MARLLVRNLEEDVRVRLRVRARQNGRSLEAEVCAILRDAVERDDRPVGGLGSEIAALFKGLGLREGDIRELRGFTIEPPTFEE